MIHETKLLQASMAGDKNAFEQIVEKYQSTVCAITFSGTGRVDLSEELAQETFLSAWKNLHQLQNLNGFRSWLCAIARNMLQKHYRRKKPVSLDSIDLLEATAAAFHGPDEIAMNNETQAVLELAILRLPDKYREPLVMFYRHEQSIQESAAALQLSEATVRTRLHRARNMLREEIATRLELVLEQTAPKKAFTKTVMVAISAIPLGMSATVEAGVTAASGSAAVGIAVKVVVVAALVALGTLTYTILNRNESNASLSQDTPGQQTTVDAVADAVLLQPMNVTQDAVPDGISQNQGNTLVASPHFTRPPLSFSDKLLEFQARGALSGIVTDAESGAPIEGLLLTLYRTQFSAFTDKTGFYSFDSIGRTGTYVILENKEYLGGGKRKRLAKVEPTKGEAVIKHFELKRGCQVQVEVVDEQGRPVPGTALRASWLGSREFEHMDLCEDKTDINGQVIVGALEASEIEYRLIAKHDDYAYAETTLKANDPNHVVHTKLTLRKGILISGEARYRDGLPAEGVTIAAKPDWWHSQYGMGAYSPVDANGIFQLPHIVPEKYDIVVAKEDKNTTGLHTYTVLQTLLPPSNDHPLVVQIPERSPQSLVAIKGSIFWETDEQPRNMKISALNTELNIRESITLTKYRGGLQGFIFDSLVPGVYTLVFEGTDVRTKIIEGVEAPCDDLEVVLTYQEKPRLRLVGEVVSHDTQKQVPQFNARIIKESTLQGHNYTSNDKWISCKKGHFDIELVGPGIYQVQIEAPGYARVLSEPVSTEENHFIKLQLSSGGNISGRVVNTQGEPVEDAIVIPLSAACGNMPVGSILQSVETFVSEHGSVKTQTNGEFSLEHLTPGKETLKVIHSNYPAQILDDIAVYEGKTTQDIVVILHEGGGVAGTVYDYQGQPEANVTLDFRTTTYRGQYGDSRDPGYLGVVVTDEKGCYTMKALPPGRVCYVCRGNISSLGMVERSFVPIAGHTTQLDFGGSCAVIDGTIVVDQTPLPNNMVKLGQPFFKSLRMVTNTDSQGNFVFHGVPQGRFSIYYQKPGQRGFWQEAATIDVGRENVNVGMIPKQLMTLEVRLIHPEATQEKWNVCLHEGLEHHSRRIGDVVRPQESSDPILIRNVKPGVHCVALTSPSDLDLTFYTLNVSCEEYGEFRESISVEAMDLTKNNRGPGEAKIILLKRL